MSWMAGVGPVKDISALGVERGLSAGWYADKAAVGEISRGSFWDVIDNPLYQVAAGIAGFDWDSWVADAKSKVGTGPNDPARRVRAMTRKASSGTRTYRTGAHPDGRSGPTTKTYTYNKPAQYEWMTLGEAKSRGLSYSTGGQRWRNKKTGAIVNEPEYEGPGATGDRIDGSTWERLRDWDVGDIGVTADLDGMQRWLTDIINVNDHLPPIIREGPKGEHYGLPPGTDVWEYYGLDEEPEPPKELEWDSYETKLQLKTAVASNVTYDTPEGIEPIDLHGVETVNYGI